MSGYIARMRELREENNYTQSEVAEVLTITQQAYSRYETEQSELPLLHLERLADFYHVSTDYILARTDFPAVPPQAGRLYIDGHTVEEMLVLMECLNDRGRRSLADYLRYLTQDAGNRS